ncbi:MAG: macro domain-containing protein [Patescibacteria group bacterium]|mgnify:CR=1 FL=1
MPCTKQKGDITKVKADVIINAANTELNHIGGVAQAISLAAGPALSEECKDQGFIPLGGYVATTAGNLKADIVIHIPTIDYQADGKIIGYDQLRSVWHDVLDYCEQEGFQSIAVPMLGAGACGMDAKRIEIILSNEAKKYSSLNVIIVVKG